MHPLIYFLCYFLSLFSMVFGKWRMHICRNKGVLALASLTHEWDTRGWDWMNALPCTGLGRGSIHQEWYEYQTTAGNGVWQLMQLCGVWHGGFLYTELSFWVTCFPLKTPVSLDDSIREMLVDDWPFCGCFNSSCNAFCMQNILVT